eukprot:350021-Chlamydomonas_euryale.AAC.3
MASRTDSTFCSSASASAVLHVLKARRGECGGGAARGLWGRRGMGIVGEARNGKEGMAGGVASCACVRGEWGCRVCRGAIAVRAAASACHNGGSTLRGGSWAAAGRHRRPSPPHTCSSSTDVWGVSPHTPRPRPHLPTLFPSSPLSPPSTPRPHLHTSTPATAAPWPGCLRSRVCQRVCRQVSSLAPSARAGPRPLPPRACLASPAATRGWTGYPAWWGAPDQAPPRSPPVRA